MPQASDAASRWQVRIRENPSRGLDFAEKFFRLALMMEDGDLDSFRSSLDANYDWPSLYPFKFIVPRDQSEAVLELFADDPVQANESSTGRFIAYTMEMNMHSCDEVIAIYQRVARVPGVISL